MNAEKLLKKLEVSIRPNSIFNLPICRRVVSPSSTPPSPRSQNILCKAHFLPCLGSRERSPARRSIPQRAQWPKVLSFSIFLIQLNNVSLKDEWEKFKLLMSFYIIVFNVKLHSLIKMQRMQHFLSKRQISMELFKIKL